jgi:hypothetical protein
MMGGPSFPLYFTGAGKTRTDKAGALAGERAVLEQLRVCWERPESLGNCGMCEKCIRTKLNFMAHGVTSLPALGELATPEQVRSIEVRNDAVMNLFKELAAQPWAGQREIKQALTDLVDRGLWKPNRITRLLKKYRRSLQKRLPRQLLRSIS